MAATTLRPLRRRRLRKLLTIVRRRRAVHLYVALFRAGAQFLHSRGEQTEEALILLQECLEQAKLVRVIP